MGQEEITCNSDPDQALENARSIRRMLHSKKTSFPETDQVLANAIIEQNFVLVSDGSFSKTNKYGTSGWVAEKTNDIHMAKGQNVTPGSAHVQCPHRSELAGILAGLCYVVDICARFGVTHGSFTLGCDGLGALDAIKKNMTLNTLLRIIETLRSSGSNKTTNSSHSQY